MKCTHCGFDAGNDAVCPVCGTALTAPQTPEPQHYPAQPNPYAQPQNPYVQPNPYAQPQNPYVQPQNAFAQQNPYMQAQNQQQNPYAQAQKIQHNPYAQPQNMQPNPYAQPQMPQAPSYPQPPYPPMPQAPDMQPHNQQPHRKKSKAAPIVITCIVATVVAAGILIASLSGALFRSPIFDRLEDISANRDTSSTYVPDRDFFPQDNYKEYHDSTTHSIGEAYTFEIGTLCLQSVDASLSAPDSSHKMYRFTWTYTNSTGDVQNIFPGDIEFKDNFGEYYTPTASYTQINDKDSDYDTVTVKGGETVTMVTTCIMGDDSSKLMTASLIINYSDTIYGTAQTDYRMELPEAAESTAPATTAP